MVSVVDLVTLNMAPDHSRINLPLTELMMLIQRDVLWRKFIPLFFVFLIFFPPFSCGLLVSYSLSHLMFLLFYPLFHLPLCFCLPASFTLQSPLTAAHSHLFAQVPHSPRTPRQKTPLVQRWELGLVNGHNEEDD